MNVHKNARLTPHGRERIVRQVESGQTLKAVGEAAGVCPRTVRKWVSRYRNEGLAGLRDRSSRPHRLHRPTPQAVVAEVARLRRQRYTGQQIAAGLRISPATVSRILRRLGLNRLAALEPAEPVRRYEREHPGELIHIDIKKLGRFNRVGHRITGDRRGQSNSRGVGWEYVHVCIDDASRIAYAEIKKSERGNPFFQWDIRIGKTLKFGERSRLELFFQGFDITNHANFGPTYNNNIRQASTFMTPSGFITPGSVVLPHSFSGELGAQFRF